MFAAFYREHREAAYAYAAGILSDSAAAEDAVAATFEKLYRRRQLIRWGTSERALLFKALRNSCLDELRRRSRQAIPSELEAEPADTAVGPDELAARRDETRRLLETLPVRDRELIALRYWADLGTKEIASVLGESQTNVTTRLSRALAQLRKELDHDHV